MAKGAYTVICYPEDLERDHKCFEPDPEHPEVYSVLGSALALGAQYAFILHDKDRYEKDDPKGEYKKGDLKKAHYHLILGWETHFPKWADFVEWQKANYCSSPGGKPHRKYYEPAARVRSIHGIMHYLTHEEWAADEELQELEPENG